MFGGYATSSYGESLTRHPGDGQLIRSPTSGEILLMNSVDADGETAALGELPVLAGGLFG